MRSAVPWSLGSAALRLLLSLFGMVLLVRHLPPEEYGVWALLAALTGPVNLLVSFGFPHLLARFLPGLRSDREVSSLLWPLVLRRLAWTTLACVVIVAAFPLYHARFGLTGFFPHVLLYQVSVLCNVGSLYLMLAFDSRFMQKEVLLLTVPYQAVLVGLTAWGVVTGRNLYFFVAVTSLLAVVNLGACAWMSIRRFGLPPASSWWSRPDEDREKRRYRRASFVGDFGVTFLGTEVDRYLIAVMSTRVDVAVYAVATTIVERLRFLLPGQIFRPLMEATFFRRYEESGRIEEIDRMFRFLFVLTAVACFAFVAVFAPLGHELLTIVFREEYAAGYTIILIYLVTMVSHQAPVGMVLKALKRAEILAYAQISVVINLGLGIYLVHRYGGLGMAVATAFSVTLKNVIMYAFARRLMKLHIPWLALAKCAGVATGVTVFVQALAGIFDYGHLLGASVGVGLAGLGYLLGLRLVQPLDSDQIGLLEKMTPLRFRPLLHAMFGAS